jgi:hypothetical protein
VNRGQDPSTASTPAGASKPAICREGPLHLHDTRQRAPFQVRSDVFRGAGAEAVESQAGRPWRGGSETSQDLSIANLSQLGPDIRGFAAMPTDSHVFPSERGPIHHLEAQDSFEQWVTARRIPPGE